MKLRMPYVSRLVSRFGRLAVGGAAFGDFGVVSTRYGTDYRANDVPIGFPILQRLTAANSASLNFTAWDASRYVGYIALFHRILPATDGAALWVRASTDQGSTLRGTGNEYRYIRLCPNAGSVVGQSFNPANEIQIHGSVENTGRGPSGVMSINQFNAGAAFHFTVKIIAHSQHSTSATDTRHMGGDNVVATNVNGFGILYSSGNITSGTMTVIGIPR